MQTILAQFRSSKRNYTYNTEAPVKVGDRFRAPQASASLLCTAILPDGPFDYVDVTNGSLSKLNPLPTMSRPVRIVVLDPVTIDPPEPATLKFLDPTSPPSDPPVPLDADPSLAQSIDEDGDPTASDDLDFLDSPEDDDAAVTADTDVVSDSDHAPSTPSKP